MGLPGVVVEAHVVVAAVVLELLPVLAVFARGQQDDVVAVVQVVQRVAEKGGREVNDNISLNMSRMSHTRGYIFLRWKLREFRHLAPVHATPNREVCTSKSNMSTCTEISFILRSRFGAVCFCCS